MATTVHCDQCHELVLACSAREPIEHSVPGIWVQAGDLHRMAFCGWDCLSAFALLAALDPEAGPSPSPPL